MLNDLISPESLYWVEGAGNRLLSGCFSHLDIGFCVGEHHRLVIAELHGTPVCTFPKLPANRGFR